MKNGGKNKSVAFIILFSVYMYIRLCVCINSLTVTSLLFSQ